MITKYIDNLINIFLKNFRLKIFICLQYFN
jgi:hypothetical protein